MPLESEFYRQYLERLTQLVYQELVAKVAVFDYFTKHAYGYGDEPSDVEPLIWFFQSGLYYDVTFSLFRLIDQNNSDRNVYHFLNYTEQNVKKIAWKKPLPAGEIKRLRDSMLSVSPEVNCLIKRRNKFFGHYDKEFFYEPDKIEDEYPFTNQDAVAIVRVLQGVVASCHEAFFGSRPMSVEGFYYAHAEGFYEALRAKHLGRSQTETSDGSITNDGSD